MLRVYTCIVHEHDFRLVLVAGIICLLAALTAFALLERARAAGRRRGAWLSLTAFVSGTGIWSTHFVAMLAFQPQLPIGYDPGLTLLSVAAAVLITGLGWALSLRGSLASALAEESGQWLAGAGMGAASARRTSSKLGCSASRAGTRASSASNGP